MQNEATVGIDLANRDNLRPLPLQRVPELGHAARRASSVRQQNNDRNFSAKLVSNSTWQARSRMTLKTTVGADYTNLENDGVSASGTAAAAGRAERRPGGACRRRQRSCRRSTRRSACTCRSRRRSAIACSSRSPCAPTRTARSARTSSACLSRRRACRGSSPTRASSRSSTGSTQFRLRCAYGASGVQPGARRRCRRSRVDGQPRDNPGLGVRHATRRASLANALGNPDLKPETSTEFENGLRVAAVQQPRQLRLHVLQQEDARRAGQQADRRVVGRVAADACSRTSASVQNTGIEARSTTTLIDRRTLGWDMTVGGSHNSNKILSLGVDADGDPNPTIGTGTTRDSLGLPVNGCSTAVHLRRRERRRHHHAERSHRRTRAIDVHRLLAAARHRRRSRTASTCSAASCASRC